jgi:aminopeptidase N
LRDDWLRAWRANQTPGPYAPNPQSTGRRALKNLALSYLAELGEQEFHALTLRQYTEADNMTDRLAALSALASSTVSGKDKLLADFYREFEHEPLVVDKWFSLQAVAHATDVSVIRSLMKHPAFSLRNPNRARSLIFSFCNGNPANFHAPDGSGYAFWAEQVIALNATNPQVAARLARSLDQWRKYAPSLQQKMKAALQEVAAASRLSKDVMEIVTKSLAG